MLGSERDHRTRTPFDPSPGAAAGPHERFRARGSFGARSESLDVDVAWPSRRARDEAELAAAYLFGPFVVAQLEAVRVASAVLDAISESLDGERPC